MSVTEFCSRDRRMEYVMAVGDYTYDEDAGDLYSQALNLYRQDKFAEAAWRAKEAGYDMVELHGAHGYLIAQFLSPYINKRKDEYGKNFEGRMKFPLQIISSIRKKVGNKFPLLFRISASECINGGLTLDDTRVIVKRLEEVGIDAIDVSVGLRETAKWTHAPMAIPRGYQVHLAEEIKKCVSIPVITVGRINDPLLADDIIKEATNKPIPPMPGSSRFKGEIYGTIEKIFAKTELHVFENPLTFPEVKPFIDYVRASLSEDRKLWTDMFHGSEEYEALIRSIEEVATRWFKRDGKLVMTKVVGGILAKK